jgi:hypothetical protein
MECHVTLTSGLDLISPLQACIFPCDALNMHSKLLTIAREPEIVSPESFTLDPFPQALNPHFLNCTPLCTLSTL